MHPFRTHGAVGRHEPTTPGVVAAKVEAAGGKLQAIPAVGRFAVDADPPGGTIAAIGDQTAPVGTAKVAG